MFHIYCDMIARARALEAWIFVRESKTNIKDVNGNLFGLNVFIRTCYADLLIAIRSIILFYTTYFTLCVINRDNGVFSGLLSGTPL